MPNRIARYEVLSLLGRGGMGEVYLAHDPVLQRKVAIKLLRPQLTSDPEAVARFEGEARAASSLNHPNIVTIHEIGSVHDGRFIAMEYVEGRALSAMADGSVAPAIVRAIGRQLAEALRVAHAAGIVHRDVKPENIMLRPDGYVKMLDFGVARLLPDGDPDARQTHFRTAAGLVIGTPRYMSPEQIRGDSATTASDVFSLGAVLYELTTGRHPSERQAVETRRDPLDDLIRRMLESQPADRPSAADVEREIRQQESMDGVLRATTHRNRVLFGALSLALAVAVLLVVAEYRKIGREEVRAAAGEVFYQLRALDRDLVRLRQLDPRSDAVREAAERGDKLAKAYDSHVELLGVYDGKGPEERATLRLARRLGEADLEMPDGFYELTMDFVQRWSRSPRLIRAIAAGRERQLIPRIRQALETKGLPKEFVLLALQESGFDRSAVGPRGPTGAAKGLWQITPDVARRYGLTLGPLVDKPVYDEADERHDELRSTEAAVNFLADLYSSKAAASALLVMASYNAGEGAVLQRLESLPDDPRARNFWNFYKNQWLSAETRDYVMSIFSAALICDQPELFNLPLEPIW